MALLMKMVIMNSTMAMDMSAAAAALSGVSHVNGISEASDDPLTRTSAAGAASSDSPGGVYDIPPWMAICLALVYFSVSVCAVIGNWMVLWIVIRSKIMRNVTNLFIANLALADIMIGALAIPFQFQAALLQKWLLPYFMCSFCPTIQVVSLNVSIFTLVTLSIDRHRAVTQPLKPRISKRTGYLIISGIWIISILAAVPTFLAFQITFVSTSSASSVMIHLSNNDTDANHNYNYSLVQGSNYEIGRIRDGEGSGDSLLIPVRTTAAASSFSSGFHEDPNDADDLEILNQSDLMSPMCWPQGLDQNVWKTYNHVLVALQYLLPIIIISITYIHMAIVLSSGPGIMNESRSESDRVNHSKRRVIKMLFIVIAIFAICWLPFQAYNILQEIYPSINDYKYINLIWFMCHLFAMSNSCYNPFIYAIYGEKFNQEFRHRFYCCCFWASRISSSSLNSGTTAATSAMNPATPTGIRSGDQVTCSQITHLNTDNSSSGQSVRKHQANNYPLKRLMSSSSSCNKNKKTGIKSPAFHSSPILKDGEAMIREKSSESATRHKMHLLCRMGREKDKSLVSKVNNGHSIGRKDQPVPPETQVSGGCKKDPNEDVMDEVTRSGPHSPILSEREVCLSLSSSSSKKSATGCNEPLLLSPDEDEDAAAAAASHHHGKRDSKVSYV